MQLAGPEYDPGMGQKGVIPSDSFFVVQDIPHLKELLTDLNIFDKI